MQKLLSISDVCETINVGRVTLWRMVKAGKFPPPVKIHSMRRWKVEDVHAWIAEQPYIDAPE